MWKLSKEWNLKHHLSSKALETGSLRKVLQNYTLWNFQLINIWIWTCMHEWTSSWRRNAWSLLCYWWNWSLRQKGGWLFMQFAWRKGNLRRRTQGWNSNSWRMNSPLSVFRKATWSLWNVIRLDQLSHEECLLKRLYLLWVMSSWRYV